MFIEEKLENVTKQKEENTNMLWLSFLVSKCTSATIYKCQCLLDYRCLFNWSQLLNIYMISKL